MNTDGADRVWDLRRWLADQQTPASAELIFQAPNAINNGPPRSTMIYSRDRSRWETSALPKLAFLVPGLVFKLSRARVLSSCGVMTSDNRWLGGAGWHGAVDVEAFASIFWKHFNKAPATPVEAGLWLGQGGDHVFGHCLLDILPLAVLLDAHAPATLPFIVSETASGALEGLLSLVGIDRKVLRIPLRAPVAVGDLYVGSRARQNYCFDASRRQAFDRLQENSYRAADRIAEPNRKVHLSRQLIQQETKTSSRDLLNRRQVDSIMQDAGFTVIVPETLPFPEQLRIMEGAEMISGEVGSAMHLSLFARPGATKVVLRNEDNPNPLDLIDGGLADLNIRFIEGTSHGRAYNINGRRQAIWTNPWRLDPKVLQAAMSTLG